MRPSIIWPMFVAGIALTSLSGATWLVHSAHSDPSFAVEPDYYAKAVRWDEFARQHQQNERLGWRLGVQEVSGSRLTVRLVDREEHSIESAAMSAVAFANARASERFDLDFQAGHVGTYTASFSPSRGGSWHFRFNVKLGADLFTAEFDHALSEAPTRGGTP